MLDTIYSTISSSPAPSRPSSPPPAMASSSILDSSYSTTSSSPSSSVPLLTDSAWLTNLHDSLSSTLNSLNSLYTCMGVTPSEKHFLLQELSSHLESVMDRTVKEAEESKESLIQQREGNRRMVREISRVLDEPDMMKEFEALSFTPLTSSSDNTLSNASATITGLRPLCALENSFLRKATEKKKLSQTVVSAFESDLIRLYEELSIPLEQQLVDKEKWDMSQKRIGRLKEEIHRILSLKQSRIKEMKDLSSSIMSSCNQMQLKPDTLVLAALELNLNDVLDKVNNRPLGVEVIASLQQRLLVVEKEKSNRMRKIEALFHDIIILWNKLQIDLPHRVNFCKSVDWPAAAVNGVEGMNVNNNADASSSSSSSPSSLPFLTDLPLPMSLISKYECELNSLKLLKAGKISSLIEEVKKDILLLHDQLRYNTADSSSLLPQEGKCKDIDSDTELALLEKERERLSSLLSSLTPIFKLIDQREKYRQELAEFEISSNDPNRFKSRAAYKILAVEEKMRGIQQNTLPKLEGKLITMIGEWERGNGQMLMINGGRYAEKMDREIEEEKEKQQEKKRIEEEMREKKKMEKLSTYREKSTVDPPVAPSTALVKSTSNKSKSKPLPSVSASSVPVSAPVNSTPVKGKALPPPPSPETIRNIANTNEMNYKNC